MAPTGTASQNYQGYRNSLTKTASTKKAPTGTASQDDGAKTKWPHLNLQAYIHGLDNIHTKIVSFNWKVIKKTLETTLFKNSYLTLLQQNQNQNGPSKLQAYIQGLDDIHTDEN